jgi:hypothetical protein
LRAAHACRAARHRVREFPAAAQRRVHVVALVVLGDEWRHWRSLRLQGCIDNLGNTLKPP